MFSKIDSVQLDAERLGHHLRSFFNQPRLFCCFVLFSVQGGRLFTQWMPIMTSVATQKQVRPESTVAPSGLVFISLETTIGPYSHFYSNQSPSRWRAVTSISAMLCQVHIYKWSAAGQRDQADNLTWATLCTFVIPLNHAPHLSPHHPQCCDPALPHLSRMIRNTTATCLVLLLTLGLYAPIRAQQSTSLPLHTSCSLLDHHRPHVTFLLLCSCWRYNRGGRRRRHLPRRSHDVLDQLLPGSATPFTKHEQSSRDLTSCCNFIVRYR